MSKTYNLTATLYTGRTRTQEENWTAFDNASWSDWVNNKGYAGKDDPWYYATAMQFDSSTLSALRSKNVTGITLEVNCTQAMTGESYISYKYNNTWSGNSNSAAWARSTNGGSSASSGSTANAYTIPAQSLSTGTKIFTLRTDTPYNGVPVYGLVAGPRLTVSGRWRFTSATLHITTDETDYTYTLSYNANGGSGAPSSQQQTVTAGGTAPSMTFTISNTRPTRTGYDFLGWSTSSSASTASYQPGGSITVSGNTPLYAVWKAITYTVSYNANGGSGAPASQTKSYNVALTLSGTAPTRTGYTFLGWSTSSSATTATYSAGGSYTTNASATLYAVWQVITYTITYKPGSSGTGSQSTATKTYNVSLTLKGATFTRTGYAQTGWATSDGGAQAYALSASYTANAAATLFPVWTATKSTVSATNGYLNDDNNKCVITITSQNSSFKHTLTYSYGSATGTIASNLTGASPITYNWKPSVDLAAQFPSAKSGTCTITCTTYNGSTNLGSSTTTCTLTIPSSVCCTVNSVTLAETVAGLNSQFGGFVQGKSKVSVTGSISSGSGSPAYGATVSSYAITINGQTLTSNGATTGFLTSSGNNLSYSFKVTDSRGYSHTKSGTYTVLAYSAPTISATINRNSSDSSKIDINYSYSISPVTNNGVNKNTKGLSVLYKPVGGAQTTISLTATNYSATNQTYQITGLDGNTAYEVTIRAGDYFQWTPTTSQVKPTGNRVFDISSTDKTMARHGSNPSDGWDHQYFNEQFHGVVDVAPRRAYATLSSEGWYRVAQFDAVSESWVSGGIGFTVDLTVFDWARQATRVTLWGVSGALKFANEQSNSYLLMFDKVRYMKNGTHGYIDVHYTAIWGDTRYMTCHFTVHEGSTNGVPPATIEAMWKAVNFTSVAASPSGETELALYTFVANTNVARTYFTPTFSGTANPSVSSASCYYSIKDGVMYAGGRFNLTSFTSGSKTVYFTLPVSLGIADRGTETIGTVFTSTKILQLRSYGAEVYITDGGGNYSGGLLSTGYWSFQIVAPIYN